MGESDPVQPSLLLRGEVAHPSAPPRLALAAKAFRPFFLLAAAFACAIIPTWILVLGGVTHPGAYLAATIWHAHEMVFGFAVAVIAGFLLTAVGTWTGRETLVGGPLLALAALWVAGRIAMALAGLLPRSCCAAVDLAFLPVLIAVVARPLVAARNWRNFVVLAILFALVAANIAVHLDALGIAASGFGRRACLVAIDLVVLVILIISGRVLPTFTRNATGAASIRSNRVLDVLTIVAMALLTVFDVVARERAGTSAAAGVVGLLAIARAVRWGTRHTARHPLLWILHAGYAWLVLGLLLRAIAGFYPAASGSLATHALAVGAIGSLTLGMMARVAMGHTGRPLVAPKPVVWGFGAITAAAFARVIVPLFFPAWYFMELVAAAGLWTAAFILYLLAYVPVLSAPRLDGKPG